MALQGALGSNILEIWNSGSFRTSRRCRNRWKVRPKPSSTRRVPACFFDPPIDVMRVVGPQPFVRWCRCVRHCPGRVLRIAPGIYCRRRPPRQALRGRGRPPLPLPSSPRAGARRPAATSVRLRRRPLRAGGCAERSSWHRRGGAGRRRRLSSDGGGGLVRGALRGGSPRRPVRVPDGTWSSPLGDEKSSPRWRAVPLACGVDTRPPLSRRGPKSRASCALAWLRGMARSGVPRTRSATTAAGRIESSAQAVSSPFVGTVPLPPRAWRALKLCAWCHRLQWGFVHLRAWQWRLCSRRALSHRLGASGPTVGGIRLG